MVSLSTPAPGFKSQADRHVGVPDQRGLRERAMEAGAGSREGVFVLRDRGDSATMRVLMPSGESVVMKFWDRRGWRGTLRSSTGTSPASREWHAIRRLWGSGVPVPRPRARFRLHGAGQRFTEALVVDDLGPVSTAHDSLKAAIGGSRAREAMRIEEDLVRLTRQVVDAGVLDPDHSMYNVVLDAEGRLWRLDMELARHVVLRRLAVRLYGAMLARLMGSYVFAVQPDMDRAAAFGRRLADELRPSRTVLRRARAGMDAMLEKQRATKGIESRVTLDW